MVPLEWALERGIPAHSQIAPGIQLPSTTGRGPLLALRNPLAPKVSLPRKAAHSPGIWAHFAAAWAAHQPFAAVAWVAWVAWVEASAVVEWAAAASTGVAVGWVADTVAVEVEVTGKFKFKQTFP